MRLYKTKKGLVIEQEEKYYLIGNPDWDTYINDDGLYSKLEQATKSLSASQEAKNWVTSEILAPIQNQEIWACGVTYFKSKVGRQEESKNAGGGDFYARVYEADRPEIFFKSTAQR